MTRRLFITDLLNVHLCVALVSLSPRSRVMRWGFFYRSGMAARICTKQKRNFPCRLLYCSKSWRAKDIISDSPIHFSFSKNKLDHLKLDYAHEINVSKVSSFPGIP
jgi:hypothetical protein